MRIPLLLLFFASILLSQNKTDFVKDKENPIFVKEPVNFVNIDKKINKSNNKTLTKSKDNKSIDAQQYSDHFIDESRLLIKSNNKNTIKNNEVNKEQNPIIIERIILE